MPLTVVVVDDDQWKRTGIATRLGQTAGFAVAASMDQNEAASIDQSYWKDIDVVLVDIFDDQAVGRIGTDLYSGIRVINRVRDLDVKSIAITPSCAHPLVQLRLEHARPDYSYHRYELNTLEALAEAARFPERRLQAVGPSLLKPLGARNLVPNKLVSYYEASDLHGKLFTGVTLGRLKATATHRSPGDLKRAAIQAGYAWTDTAEYDRRQRERAREDGGTISVTPRWPQICNLMLTLLGRLDAPWSEHDHPWWGG